MTSGRARRSPRVVSNGVLRRSSLRAVGVALVFLLVLLANPAQAADPDIVMWGHPACSHCRAAHAFLDGLRERRLDLQIVEHDVTRAPETYEELRARTEQAGLDMVGLPSFVVRGRFLVGFDTAETTGRQIEALLAPAGSPSAVEHGPAHAPGSETPRVPESRGAASEGTIDLPVFGRVSPEELGLPLFTIVIGLVDGFNPCAMWVLVFLVGLLVGMRDPVRMWTYGAVFLLTSGLVYLAFMAAWLNLFLYVGSLWWIRTGVALFALGAAGYYLWQFITNPEGACVATSASQHQRVMARLEALVAERSFLVAIAGLVTLAVAVNMVELVCSAGVPAIYTEVLSHSSLPPLAYYGYLLLYISVFMLDDAIVFVTAMLTLRATGLTASYARYAHLVGAVVLAGLGVIMLLRPEWLALA